MKISFIYSPIAGSIGGVAVVLLSLFLALSCADKKQTDTRMQEVIAVHDSVMPKMGEIGQLISRLKPLADSTASDSRYANAISDLEQANTAMMDWMQGFGDRFDYAEIQEGKTLSAQKSEWLDEELVKVKEMARAMNESISQAESLLKNSASPE
ncbi:hypothetical protein [Robiginitalea sp.]|uniref:hypothetical protein n=1 Tax=Robiginitalea sp. TaxID=1902411 RepID=UPI003C443CB7